MSAVDLSVSRLQLNEGFRSSKYVDTTGHESIGYGFNITAGITPFAATALLNAQARELSWALAPYPWFDGLDDVRASVLVELAFNLGLAGLTHFVRFLDAVKAKDWATAKAELLDSSAARALPIRYHQLAQLIGDTP